MKFYTYILESATHNKLYIGQTSDLKKRIERHNNGGSLYTRGKGPWNLIFSVEFSTRTEAILLEQKLKNSKNPAKVREWISRQNLII